MNETRSPTQGGKSLTSSSSSRRPAQQLVLSRRVSLRQCAEGSGTCILKRTRTNLAQTIRCHARHADCDVVRGKLAGTRCNDAHRFLLPFRVFGLYSARGSATFENLLTWFDRIRCRLESAGPSSVFIDCHIDFLHNTNRLGKGNHDLLIMSDVFFRKLPSLAVL